MFQLFRCLTFKYMKIDQEEQGNPIIKSKWGTYTEVAGFLFHFIEKKAFPKRITQSTLRGATGPIMHQIFCSIRFRHQTC